MPASVVCVSRTLGALGEEVGQAVARELGFRHVDEEIVSLAAQRSKAEPELVADAERRKSFIVRLLEDLGRGGVADAYTALEPLPDSDEYRSAIREAIDETATAGRVVIVSHAAGYALAGREGVLRVLVTASPDTRAGRVAGVDVIREDVAKRIEASDRNRADYLRRFYGVKEELPVHYDLVLNTDGLSVEQAAALVVQAARG